jgi:NAD(P)-dependent dehydrogenase (short-subunit alcohol dehydrogenase family)
MTSTAGISVPAMPRYDAAMSLLEKQVVLVTGCSTGIGRALACELAGRGHRVFASARRLESISDLAVIGAQPLELDVTQPESIARAVGSVLQRVGRIDVLVNNAGVNTFGPLTELPLEKVRSLFETNVLGLLAVTQAVFAPMAERRSGRLINVGSVVGLLPTPFAGAYCASKAAVHMLSEVLRMELQPFGIDVVVVQPGGVKSSIADSGSGDIARYDTESSKYRPAYNGIVKRAYASQDNPMPAEEFARQLVEQAFETPPPRTIRLGTGADYLPQLAEMPPEQRDPLLSKAYELDRLA